MKRLVTGSSAPKVVSFLLALSLGWGFRGLAFGRAPQASAKGIEGDWQGTLKPGGAELRLALHIAKADDGSYKATMDSIDQGANGISVTSMSLKDSKLTFTVDSVRGSYEGTVSADGTAISGTWSQGGQSLPLDFKRATAPIKTEHKPAKPSDIDGAWLGTVEAGAIKLRVVFHITNTEDGLMATLDSPDPGRKRDSGDVRETRWSVAQDRDEGDRRNMDSRRRHYAPCPQARERCGGTGAAPAAKSGEAVPLP